MLLNREAFISMRLLSGFSQAQLARDSGVSQGYISELEKDDCKKNPSPATIKKLADALGVPVGALMNVAAAVAS